MTKITRLKIGFAAGILVMLANALIPYQTFAWLTVANEAADETDDIIAAAEGVLSTLKDAETGHRGYIITGRREFLKPYEAAQREIRPQLVRLHTLLAVRPESATRLATLDRLVDEKIRYMERLNELRRTQGLEPSVRTITEGKGKQLMDEIRDDVKGLITAEQGRQVELKREKDRRSAIAAYALALVTFVDLLVLGLVYHLVFRTIAERTAVETELRVMGEQLKAGVDSLAARNREMETFHRMTDALQSCETTQETYDLIGKYGGQLFPGSNGALYVLHSSRDLLESVCAWGADAGLPPMFEREQCWALRRSQAHVMNDRDRDVVCAHVDAGRLDGAGCLCTPLMAQGEAIGLIHVEGRRGPGTAGRISETTRVVAATLAEQASLSLSNMRLRETMRQQSITDALTGLHNRRYLDETLRRELARAGRRGLPVAVIMLDVDHFKRFNDSYGHDAGDAVLRSLAALMQKHARAGDVLCRYGGEEFAMIMPEMTEAIAVDRAGRLCEAARLLNVSYGGRALGRITISAGVAMFPAHATEAQALLLAADGALYAAKQGGRDRVVVAQAPA